MTRPPFASFLLRMASPIAAAGLAAACAFPQAEIVVSPEPLVIVAGGQATAAIRLTPLACEPDEPLPCADLSGRLVDYRVAGLPEGLTGTIDRSVQSPATPDLVRISVDVGPDVEPGGGYQLVLQAIVDGRLVGTGAIDVRVRPAGPTQPLPPPIALSAGSAHSLAVLADGRVAAWGENGHGQLGLGDRRNRDEPAIVADLSGVTAVSAGDRHSLALDGTGRVWAWGDNWSGQLGDGTIDRSGAIRTRPAVVAGLTDVIAIAAGTDHSLALAGDGTVWAWGSDQRGKLGLGEFSGSTGVPTAVQGLPAARAIAAGWGHSLAAAADGTVWIWGGHALGAEEVGSSAVPIQVAGLTDIHAVVTGHGTALAIDGAGQLWAWGDNFRRQLGDGTTTPRMLPGRVAGLAGVTAAGVGEYGSVALGTDGRLWEWGDGLSGDVDPAHRLPHPVSGFADVTLVARRSHVLATLRCGQTWAWGFNGAGALGVGGFDSGFEPAIVPRLGGGEGCDRALLRVSIAGDAMHAANLVTAAGATLPSNGTDLAAVVPTGTSVTLTAAPTAFLIDGSSAFEGWAGDCAGVGPQTTVLVDRARHCVARYRRTSSPQLLRVSSDGGVVTSTTGHAGDPTIDCGQTCEAVFRQGTVVTLTAAPSPGFTFTGWLRDCSGTGPVTTVTMDTAKTCRADFRPFALSVTVTGTGSVTADPGGLVCEGTCSAEPRAGDVTLVATPAPGWRFEGWGGDCSGTAAQTSVAMTADRSCTATFGRTPGQYFLTVVVDGAGSVASQPAGIACPATCVGVFGAGTVVTLTATPAPTQELSFWLDDCAAIGFPTNEVVMTGDLTCRARFTGQPAHPVAQFLWSSNAADRRVGDLVFFNGHQSHVFDPVTGAEDPSGITGFFWFFDGDDVSDVAGSRSTAAIAQYAFQAPGSHTVRLRVQGGPFDTTDEDEAILLVSPATGLLSGLTVQKAGTGTGTIRSEPPGLLTCRGPCQAAGPVMLNPTVSVTLVAAAAPGSSFAGWSGDGCTSTAPSVEVPMTTARTCTATFVPDTVTLTVVASAPTGLPGRIVSLQPAGLAARAERATFRPGG